MKKFALFFALSCLLAFSVRPQAVPGTYPYPVPLPTNGTTPGGTVKVSAPVNTISYSDNRPVYWDVFGGGGYRVVGTTNERNSIITGRRKEGMWVKVTADDHVYELDSDLTTWIDLGAATAGVFSGVNIYNTSSSLTANRTLTGAGFSLDFTGLSSFGVVSTVSQTLAAPTININGGSFTKINNAGPDPFIFPAAPSVATGSDEIMARNPSTDEVTYSPSYTLSMVGTVPDGYVTLAKMADLAQDQFIGRTSASTGVPQTATITAAARTVLDDSTVSAMVDTLGGASATGTGGLVRRDSPSFTTTATTPDLTITQGSISSADQLFDATTTWNNGATTFTALKLNVTDTASAAASKLFDFQVGGSTKLSIRKSGAILLPTTSASVPLLASEADPTTGFYSSGAALAYTEGGSLSWYVFQNKLELYQPTFQIVVASDTIFRRKSAANWCSGDLDAASPVSQTSSVQSVATGVSNTAGVDRTFTGSAGTGTGAGGSIIFQTAPAGSSGTSQNAQVTALTINSSQATIAGGVVRLKGYTVATLPAGTAGDTAYVTDATAPTYNGALTGGGAVTIPVFYNGSAWVSH